MTITDNTSTGATSTSTSAGVDAPPAGDLRSHYVRVGHGEMHVRIGGRGPVVVLAHMSPLSTRSLLPLARLLLADYTVVAIDTPGHGESDALPFAEPTIDHYAAAFEETIAALGCEPALLYGAHTGAKLMLAMVRRGMSGAAGLLLDGIALGDDAEREEKLREYTPSLAPEWHGGHLLASWHQLRAVEVFWPWYRQTVAPARLDAVDIELLHRDTVDLLRSVPDYGLAYRAAFRQDPLDELHAVAAGGTPIWVVLRDGHHHAAEFAARAAAGSAIATVPVGAGHAVEEVAAFLRARRPDLDDRSPRRTVAPPARRTPAGVERATYEAPLGTIVRTHRPGNGRPIVMVDDQLTPRLSRELLAALPPGRPVDVLELRPEDGPGSRGDVDATAWRDQLAGALAELELTAADLFAANAWAALAAGTFAAGTVTRWATGHQPSHQAAAFPTTADADPSGAHLVRAWHALRDAHVAGAVAGCGGGGRGPGGLPTPIELQDVLSWTLTRTAAAGALTAAAADQRTADGGTAPTARHARAALAAAARTAEPSP